jgi:hypothetical protein
METVDDEVLMPQTEADTGISVLKAAGGTMFVLVVLMVSPAEDVMDVGGDLICCRMFEGIVVPWDLIPSKCTLFAGFTVVS